MLKKIIKFINKLMNINFNATGIKNEINTKFQKAENYNNYNITISHTGLTHNDVKSIALEIYNENFPRLISEAKETANNRINNFLEKLIPLICNDQLNRFSDTGLQYDFNNVLKTIAIKGSIEINDLLINILLDRLNSNSDFDSTVLSSIIDKISKISIEELNILGLYILTKNNNINDLSEQTILNLLKIDKERCSEYCSTLASNGLVHWTGGFATYPNFLEEVGIMSDYKKQINDILRENIFINFEVLHYGKIIAEKYINILNNNSCKN